LAQDALSSVEGQNFVMPDFRAIPSIEQLRQRPAIRALEAQFGAEATVGALRAAAAEARRALAGGASAEVVGSIEQAAATQLAAVFRPSLAPVINATGVVIHTNLGRAPLAAAAIERVADVARGYSSLEYDVDRGARGRRDVHAEGPICRLTGAEAAVVVNNNAAATMIVLAALAAGREVIVSRGELVEIGGGFRVPDVMAQSGATLREVGTTNKTRAADYAAAITEKTALILRVHPSNFTIEGFTERPHLAELVAIGKKFNIPVAEDLGSGNVSDQRSDTVSDPGSDAVSDPGSDAVSDPGSDAVSDPTVAATIAAGVDVCCFSGDKLLGGPQAGIIVGRRAQIDRIRKHPLMRALRVDKMTYAALEATLAEYVAGRAQTTVPVQRMLTMTAAEIRARADAVANAIHGNHGWRADVVKGVSAIGGGSAPGVELPTWVVAIEKTGTTPDSLEAALRRQAPPIIARIERDRVLLDLRTVLPEQDSALLTCIARL
jgi:L-seryl-tRNA(Ser) seleniumtransferase